MYYYLMTLEYDGTNYCGMQFQKNLKTIQGEVNLALAKIIPSPFSTFGASRTDTGVHAINQVVKLTSKNKIDFDLKTKLNQLLPPDILINSFQAVDRTFHPTKHYTQKEYRYFFTNQKIKKHHCPYIANISNPLDLKKMQEGVKLILGEKNFCNFYSKGSNVTSTIRTIYQCELTTIKPQNIFKDHPLFIFDDNIYECYQFKIVANGFLKQMNRHLMSAFWSIGSGKMELETFIELLNSNEEFPKKLWKVAPSTGLFLFELKK